MENLFSKDYSSTPPLKPINEVASELKIEAYIIRFWETKFKQINPTKGKGNRRLYSESDIEILQLIKGLLYDKGYTIEGAKKYLDGNKEAKVETVNFSNEKIDEVISELQNIKSEIEFLKSA